jgi:hypothetical protein
MRGFLPKLPLVILTLALAACSGSPSQPAGGPTGLPAPQPTGPPTTRPTPLAIPADGAVEQTLPPDTSPTSESPTLRLVITVADEHTRRPVVADVTVDGSTADDVSYAEVLVAANVPHTVTVSAPGYLPWAVRIESTFERNKVMELPVLLRPAGDTG